jgi:hypothetical protein
MARNRKSQSAALRFGPALKASVLCLLIGGSGVGYVWQKDQLGRLSQVSKVRESRLQALRRENSRLRTQLSFMYSPRRLEERAKELHLGLVPPQASQVVSLAEPGVDAPTPESVRQYASQTDHTSVMP